MAQKPIHTILAAAFVAFAPISSRPVDRTASQPSTTDDSPRASAAGEARECAVPESARGKAGTAAPALPSGTADVVCPEGASRHERVSEPLRTRGVWCETEDGVRHGPYRAWWESGRLSEEFNYRFGAQDGLARTWFQDGTLATEETYRDGVPVGTFRRWHGNGQLAGEAHFRGGKCVGTSRFWDMRGRLIEERKDCIIPKTRVKKPLREPR